MPVKAVTTTPVPLSSLTKTGAFWVSATLTVIVLAVAVKEPADLLLWKPQFGSELGAALGALLLASALVERVVEVFLSIWKRSEVDSLEQELEYLQAIQGSRHKEIQSLEARLADTAAPLDPAAQKVLADKHDRKVSELDDAEARAEEIAKTLVPYQAETRRLSMWIGMAIGVLVAGVGVRFLSNLVVFDKVALGKGYSWLVMVDVLVTGAVLAGGSKGIHSLSSLLGSVIDASQARAGRQRVTEGTPSVPTEG